MKLRMTLAELDMNEWYFISTEHGRMRATGQPRKVRGSVVEITYI